MVEASSCDHCMTFANSLQNTGNVIHLHVVRSCYDCCVGGGGGRKEGSR